MFSLSLSGSLSIVDSGSDVGKTPQPGGSPIVGCKVTYLCLIKHYAMEAYVGVDV
jgi:hypothetical protein